MENEKLCYALLVSIVGLLLVLVRNGTIMAVIAKTFAAQVAKELQELAGNGKVIRIAVEDKEDGSEKKTSTP